MDKVLIGLLIVILIIGAVCGVIHLLNVNNSNEMLEYIDTFAQDTENKEQLVPQKDEHGNWYFTTDGDFKVLQLTDIHLVGGIGYTESDKKAINAVAAMVAAEDPDLVIITGDIASAYPTGLTFDNSYAHSFFIRLMENLGVYWTVTFGNHDNEPYNTHDRAEVAAMYADESLKYCLFQNSPDGVSGEGNHIINVKNTSGEITQSLIMIDSHAYIHDDLIGGTIDSIFWNYDCVKQDQVDWYEDMINLYQPKSSLMFFHIPLGEVKEAYDEYIANGRELNDDITSFTGHDGDEDEVVYSSKLENGLFEKVVELGNTKAMFFGHDHFNNFVMNYKGVIFSYGYSIDYMAYGDIGSKGYQRGCTVINIGADGSFNESNIVHENYYQDKYPSLYEKEVVDMYPYFDK